MKLETSYRYFPVSAIAEPVKAEHEVLSRLRSGLEVRWARMGETLTLIEDWRDFRAGDVIRLVVTGTPANPNVWVVERKT